jgi:hypothetical protein
MKILGCKHDCEDISALMQALMKEQGGRGKRTQEHRENISKFMTGKTGI